MTLIITSIRADAIVMTADGRSIVRTGPAVTRVDDRFQKLFPIPEHSVAIAQHGENDIGGTVPGVFLAEFMRTLNTGNLSILEIADALRSYAHPPVRRRLRQLKAGSSGCGYIVAGFGGDGRQPPTAVELFWIVRPDGAIVTEERQWRPIAVIPSGAGKGQVDAPDWHRIAGGTVADARKYNEMLLDEATHAKVDPNPVGGHVHELVITRNGCDWTIPPITPNPATHPATRPATAPAPADHGGGVNRIPP